MPLIEFELSPVEQIQPWGSPPALQLHWFGLSLGSYYLDLGSVRLLEYAVADCSSCHAEYQLARLHEDLLSMLPEILDPIPLGIVTHLCETSVGCTLRFLEEVWSASDDSDNDLDAALAAFGARQFDTGYLNPSAGIWIWTHDATTTIEWDNRDKFLSSRPAWSAEHGRYELHRDSFLVEVRNFHQRLMSAMDERVRQVCSNWRRHDVRIDFDQLQAEQIERATWLDSALRRPSAEYDWNSIEKLLSALSRRNH